MSAKPSARCGFASPYKAFDPVVIFRMAAPLIAQRCRDPRPRRVNGKDDLTVSKKEIVRTIAEEMRLDQAIVKEVVQRTLDSMLEVIATRGRLELRNFGVFEIKRRASRIARNPRTNQEVRVPAKHVLTFRAGKNIRRKMQHVELPRQ